MQISARHKIDIGLVPQTVSNTNVTGRYYKMSDARRALAVMNVGALAATKTAKIEFLQATDLAGTSAKAITGAEATVTANTKVAACTLTLASVANGDAITINGVTFTAHTDTTTASKREYSIAGTDTQDAAALAGLINDATYGVPGVTATPANAVITLTVTDPGETTITVTDAAATITVATTQALAYVELDVSKLDLTNGFEFVAPKVTSTGAGIVGVVLERGECRYTPVQAVGASASV